MATRKSIVQERCGLSCVVARCLVLLMLGPAVSTQATDRTAAMSGATVLAGLRVESHALPQGAAPQVACPADESATLRQTVPLYVQWHWFRHAQWQQDEVTAPLLEALAKEEEGQEGTAKGRGAVFRLMLATLEAADPAKAEQVKTGLPTTAVLDSVRAGAAGRTRDVTRLAQDFTAYLPCFRQHRKAIDYLLTLNQMPNFPEPLVDPAGDIGRFIGAYMRQHILVDHEAIIQSIVLAALYAHQALQPAGKPSPARTASAVLMEQALTRLDPKVAAEVRQHRGAKALKAFLDGRADIKKRQGQITTEYEEAYGRLTPAYQDAFQALAPQRPPARALARETPSAERSPGHEAPTPTIAEASPPLPQPEAPPASEASIPAPRPETPPAQAEAAPRDRRLALVIGNSTYQEGPLRNPGNDAKAMADTLRDLGFEVMAHENLTKRAMEEAIRAFGRRLKAGGVGVFYFAGHGVQVNGENYLIPLGSTIEKEQDVAYEAVDAGRVLSEMDAAENRLNIVILDACRTNPFARSFRSAPRGLAPMNAPTGTLIAYATGPNAVASDGDESHGLYTQELLQQMRRPGVKLEDVFKRVHVAVKAKTQDKQRPWETSSLEGDFYFVQP